MANVLPFFMGHQAGSLGREGMSQMGLGMAIAASMVVLTMFQQFLLTHFRGYVEQLLRKLFKSLDPNVQIRFTDDSTDGPKTTRPTPPWRPTLAPNARPKPRG